MSGMKPVWCFWSRSINKLRRRSKCFLARISGGKVHSFCKNISLRCSTRARIGSHPSIPRAISVLVRIGNRCIDLAAMRVNFSSISMSVCVMLCQSSAPYKTVGKHTLSVMGARMDGLVQPVPLSIENTENRDARPFWMRAFTAHELFIDWFKSMPTCVTDLTCWC